MRKLGLACLTLSFVAADARAADLATFVLAAGNNRGFADDVPLRYAESDATRFATALEELGALEAPRVLLGEDAQRLQEALAEVRDRVNLAHAKGSKTLVIFYYSGHADADFLRPSDSRLTWKKLKELVQGTGSDLIVTIFDACESGSATLAKGASLGAPFEVKINAAPATTGSMWITSSRSAEASYESDELGGSIFSHYLVSGLRGAADIDEDGRVTLGELYQFAYDRTVADSTLHVARAQHPTYHSNLHGEGELVLTEPQRAATTLVFPREIAGQYFVARRFGSKRGVLEVPKPHGTLMRMSVAPGSYLLYRKDPQRIWLASIEVRKGEELVVDPAKLEPHEYREVLEKGGGIVLASWEARAAIGMSGPILSGAPEHLEARGGLAVRELSYGLAFEVSATSYALQAVDTRIRTLELSASLRGERFWDLEWLIAGVEAGISGLILHQNIDGGGTRWSLSPGLVLAGIAERPLRAGVNLQLQLGATAWLLRGQHARAIEVAPFAELGLAYRF